MESATRDLKSASTSVAAGPETMKAIVQDEYGTDPEEVLRLAQIGRPGIGDDEVLVRVLAAGVDRSVWHLMAGRPYPVRLAGYGLRRPKSRVRGSDAAGIVEAVGRDVSAFVPGDEVFGVCEGAFAQYAPARPGKLAPKPASLSFEQAAAVPVSGQTALKGVREQGRVQEGEKVLVIGASGGVGSFAVQIAKAFGAEVTGVCSTGKVDLVRALGADHVIDYTSADPLDVDRAYDVILDIGGNRHLSKLRRALTRAGRLVIVGGETGGRWIGGLDRQLRAHLISPLVSQELGSFVSLGSSEELMSLSGLIESGSVAPAVDRTYPLAEVPAAIRHMTDGHARGKVVITV